MATDPVTVPRPRNVPESLGETTIRHFTSNPCSSPNPWAEDGDQKRRSSIKPSGNNRRGTGGPQGWHCAQTATALSDRRGRNKSYRTSRSKLTDWRQTTTAQHVMEGEEQKKRAMILEHKGIKAQKVPQLASSEAFPIHTSETGPCEQSTGVIYSR